MKIRYSMMLALVASTLLNLPAQAGIVSQLAPGDIPGFPSGNGPVPTSGDQTLEQQAATQDRAAAGQQQTAKTLKEYQELQQAMDTASKASDLLNKLQDFYETLTKEDQRLDASYQPPGAPDVPSQCMENDECRPCYEKGQDKLNGARKGLEKLRLIFMYTHKFAKQGEDFMSGAGAMAGNGAQLEAAVQSQHVDASLDDFDKAAKAKRVELTDHVNDGLHMVSACEAQFYHTDDWYNRYGFIYYQFILSAYGDVGETYFGK